ncbi:hypothetical protein BvCmsSIP046_00405 [Escherichia coli]|nr:Uncharacterised protein [Escherichia coli]STM50331.1 Uncharacterised protein [Escherichia coli]STN76096.1 Uncharacterised protein [Escherichia coli]GCH07595.1 hypothetical protein BvCms28BK_03817 [Escherichia coli]GCH96546.1 hypothetical protein BvCmsSIP0822_00827 [Escherichia coli]
MAYNKLFTRVDEIKCDKSTILGFHQGNGLLMKQ